MIILGLCSVEDVWQNASVADQEAGQRRKLALHELECQDAVAKQELVNDGVAGAAQLLQMLHDLLLAEHDAGLLVCDNPLPLLGWEKLRRLTFGNEVHGASLYVKLIDRCIEDGRSNLVDRQLSIHLVLADAFLAREVRVHHDAVVDDVDAPRALHAGELQLGDRGEELEERVEQARLHDELFLLDGGALNEVGASVEGVFVHVDGELEAEDAEHCPEQLLVVQDLLAIADVLVEKAVQHGDNLLELEVLDLIDQIVLVLRPVHARHGHLVLVQLLCVDVPFDLTVDIEDDRF